MSYSSSSPYLSVDMTGLRSIDTLPDRMALELSIALAVEVPRAVKNIVEYARNQLTPGHGYDTGLLHDSLSAELVPGMMLAGTVYRLGAPDATRDSGKNSPFEYYAPVEFGYTMANGVFRPGLHYFEISIQRHRGDLGLAAKRAWNRASRVLSAQAMADKSVKKLL